GNLGYRWTQATGMVSLGTPAGGIGSQAYAVSADGNTIGGFTSHSSSGGDTRAMLWTPSLGPILLQPYLGAAVPSGWTLLNIRGISADGTVFAGEGLHNGFSEGWVASVPSPGVGAF